jgi:hypothetical protein
MKNTCPIRDGLMNGVEGVPDECLTSCSSAMEKAIGSSAVGSYDVYDTDAHMDDCTSYNTASIEHSHQGIHNTGGSNRLVSLVDQCSACGHEIGEQSYRFICNNPAP